MTEIVIEKQEQNKLKKKNIFKIFQRYENPAAEQRILVLKHSLQ